MQKLSGFFPPFSLFLKQKFTWISTKIKKTDAFVFELSAARESIGVAAGTETAKRILAELRYADMFSEYSKRLCVCVCVCIYMYAYVYYIYI